MKNVTRNNVYYFRVERSKVRVTIFENSKPQQITSPELNSLLLYGDNIFGDTFSNATEGPYDSNLINLTGSDENSNKMTTIVTQLPPSYDRQQR